MNDAQLRGVTRVGRARSGGQGRDRQRRHGQDEQHRDRPDRPRAEPLDAVAQPAGEERETEHEQAVGQDRPDRARSGRRRPDPAWRAKIEMNSSGRLPSADWRTPVLPGPSRWPSWSVPEPITPASPARATAETTKTAACGRAAEAEDDRQDRRADRRRRAAPASSGRAPRGSTRWAARGRRHALDDTGVRGHDGP